MKNCKKALFFCAATVFSLLFYSCGDFSGLSIPESVSIKSGAQYSGALGQKYFDLTEKLGTQMLDEVSQKAKADVYKYVPDPSDASLKYLLHKKLYDVPLNVGEYVDSMNFDSSLNADMDFEATITLPTVSMSQSLPISGDPGSVPITLPTLLANVTLDQAIKSAKIKKGSVIVRATGSGASFDISDFSLTGVAKDAAGTQAYAASDFAAGGGTGTYLIDKKLDLANAYITIPASQVAVGGTLAKDDPSETISGTGTLTFSIVVEELSEVVIDMTQYGGFEMNSTSANKTKVSADMVKYVKTMDFGRQPATPDGYYYKSDADGNITAAKGKGKGVKFNVVNSFPAGNDIAVEIKSSTFGIDSTDGMYVNGESASASGVKIPAKGNQSKNAISFAEFSPIDVEGTLSAGDYINFSVKLSNSQTFSNLVMGATYKIAISDSEVLMDWDKVVLKLDSLDPVSDVSDMSDFSINEMLKEIDGEVSKLVNNCDIKKENLKAYFMVQRPTGALASLVSGVNFNGKIWLTYKDSSSTSQRADVIGTPSAAASLDFCDSFNWPSTTQTLTKKFAAQGTDYSFAYDDLADVLNERGTDLKVHYDITVAGGSECSLCKAKMDSMTSADTSTIAVEMALVLPLHFTTKASTTMDVYELAKMDVSDKDDLLDRSDVSKTEEYEKIAKSISYFRINYNLINSALGNVAATIEIDDSHSGEAGAAQYSGIKKTVQVTVGNASDDVVDFSPEEIKSVLTHFFKPTMKMTIDNGAEIKVLRHAVESPTALGISPVITLKLDENSPIDIKDIIKK